MTVLLNNFEGGTNGVTLTTGNTGGTSGTAFDAISIGTSATLAFDSTHAAHGTLSCKVASAGTAAIAYGQWSTALGTQTTIWFRQYLYFTGNPAAVAYPFLARTSATNAAAVAVGTNGKMQLRNAALSTVATFTNSIPLGAWFRIEGTITGDPAVGVITCTLYDSMDSVTPTETQTVTGQNTTGPMTQSRFGEGNSVTNTGPYWMDDIGVSTTGYIGPVVTATTPHHAASIVPSLIATGAI